MRRILIAEDEHRISSFLEKGLQANGFTTKVVEDGAVAAEMARDGDFDLLILDLGLPGMDGQDALKQIRRRGERLPIIVLTARSGVTDTVTSLDSGADDYVTKPFRFQDCWRGYRRGCESPAATRRRCCGPGTSCSTCARAAPAWRAHCGAVGA